MIGMTMCSGIGAPEVAAPWVDWRLASEIEAFPRAVLQERLGCRPPDDHRQGAPLLWSDMTEITPDLLHRHGIPLPDLIVAGTPCQSFSVAGLRQGTADPRGNLTLAFVEIVHAIVAARPDGRLCVVWENVPGILSDKGNAFGCFLGGLVGALGPVIPAEPPRKGGAKSCWRWNKPRRWRHKGRRKHRKGFWSPVWPGEGMVEGPRARAAWAVLDAQWFGVAQRRRRVFVVVDFGGAIDPAAILLEPDSLRGDTPPRRETGQDVAGTLSARTKGGGGLGTDFDLDGGLRAWPAEVAPTLNAHFGDKMGLEDQHALSGAGLFVPIAFGCKGTEVQSDTTGITPPLRSMGHNESKQNAGGHAAVAFAIQERAVSENLNQGPQGKGWQEDKAFTLEARNKAQAVCATGHTTHTLPASSCPPHLATPWQVRRLTPAECARLQGFSDDHCAVTYRGKPAADGPQYKAYGNSMAVPVMRWILDRLRLSFEDTTT